MTFKQRHQSEKDDLESEILKSHLIRLFLDDGKVLVVMPKAPYEWERKHSGLLAWLEGENDSRSVVPLQNSEFRSLFKTARKLEGEPIHGKKIILERD